MSRFRDAARPASLLANLQAQIASWSRQPHAREAEIHAVRKKLKRLRASLRLLRGSIGEGAYRNSPASHGTHQPFRAIFCYFGAIAVFAGSSTQFTSFTSAWITWSGF